MNIFILHTPFQLFQAEALIRQHRDRGFDRNFLLFEGKASGLAAAPDCWSETQWYEPGNASALGRLRRRDIEELVTSIRARVVSSRQARLFLSDIAWPLNNRVFFDRHLQKQAEYFLLADGLAAYTDPRLSWSYELRNLAKWLLGIMGAGVRYTPYRGNVLGQSHPRVKGIYAFRPELLRATGSPHFEITFPTQECRTDPDVCLFLDQPYRDFLSASDWRELRRKTVRELQALQVGRVLYKAHYMCDSDYLSSLEGMNFEIVNESRPIESIFAQLSAGTVVSYTSTALFNIKVMCREQVRCVALFSDFLARVDGSAPGFAQRLQRFFSDAEIELVGWV